MLAAATAVTTAAGLARGVLGAAVAGAGWGVLLPWGWLGVGLTAAAVTCTAT